MRRAFTLIEVLCTVVILGIAAAVIVPQIGSKADLELATASRQLLSDLDMARSEAITRNSTIYVAFTPASGSAGGSFSVYKKLSPLTSLNNPFTKSTWTIPFGTGTLTRVKLSAANFDSNTILAFNPDGAPLAVASASSSSALTSGTITLSDGGKTMSVKIEPGTGALSVQ